MAFTVNIGPAGALVDRTNYVRLDDSITVSRALNERDTASFVCLPGLLPSRLHEVQIYRDAVLEFAGVILSRRLEGFFESDHDTTVTLDCADYSAYLDWFYLSLSYTTDQTLDTVLAAAVALLPSGYGITKGGSGYTDTIKPFTWTNMRASDAFRELANATGRGLIVSTAKVLSMPALPTGSGPESYTDAGTKPLTLEWEDPSEVPANTVIVSCGPTGSAYHTYAWTANGSASSWQMDIPAVGPGVSRTLLLVIGGSNVYATVDEGGGGWFTWDWATRTISVNTYPLTLPIPNGTPMSFEYVAQYPFAVMRPASLPATPIVALFKDETITEYARGVDAADGQLDKLSGSPRSLTFTTLTHGWSPGQTVSISMASYRNFNASALVRSVTATMTPAQLWQYRIEADEASVYAGSYLDEWRSLTGSGSGTPILATSGGGGGGGGGGSSTSLTGSGHLGGSRSELLLLDAWTRIVDWQTWLCGLTATYPVRVEFRTEDAATSVQVRIWDETANTVVSSGTTAASTSTTWTSQTLLVALVAGHRYRAEVNAGNTTNPVQVGQVTVESQVVTAVGAILGDGPYHLATFGDSKTVYGNQTGGWALQLKTALETATGATWASSYYAAGSTTLADARTAIASILAQVPATAGLEVICCINWGVNEMATMPSEATWIADYQYIIDQIVAKQAAAKIVIMRPWYVGKDSEAATMHGWIDQVVSSRSAVVFLGADEAVWLKGSDNGATMTSDGVHYSTAGHAECSAQELAVITA